MQSIPGVGEILGHKYRVLGLLGQGGMGAVLEAEHSVTRKRVAIKWMNPEIASNPDAQARFVREAQASARVRHPNIVDVYDVVHDGESLFLVMELLEGETLTELLRRGGMPIHKLIELLLPALRAVAAAHREGVIHRDLKPDNIFLARHADSPAPVPKVLDFGISKVTDTTTLALTRTGSAMGTPMYMSLEQLCGERDLDARADVYALGVILYEAVTGRSPFAAETFSELAIKVATVEPPGPKEVRPELPSALGVLIARAMAKKRENRLASVDELLRELTPFASEQSFRAKMTHARAPIPAVRGESEPPAASTAPFVVPAARPVEASPTYSKASTTSAPTKSHAPRIAFALVLACVCGLALWKLTSSPGRPGPTAAPAALVQPPAPPALAKAAPSEPQVAAAVTPPAEGLSADAGLSPGPAALPLAPKTQHRTGGTRATSTRDPLRAPARPSVVKRAGPARPDDF